MAPRPSPAKNASAASRTTGIDERRTEIDCICRASRKTGPTGGNVNSPVAAGLQTHRMMLGMKTVAIIGASPDRHKFGNKALRAFREAGYRAIPITPHHTSV